MEKIYYTPLENFLFFIAGTDKELLNKGELTEADEAKQKQFGGAMIISVLLFSINVFFLVSVFSTTQFAFGGAVIAAIIAIYLERTMFHYKELSSVVPRILMVFASAFFLSSGMSFFIQKDKIQQDITDETVKINTPLDSTMQVMMNIQRKEITELTTGFDDEISTLKNREIDGVQNMDAQSADQNGRKDWSNVLTIRRTLKSTIADREKKLKEMEDRHKKETADLKAVLEPQRYKPVINNQVLFDRFKNAESNNTDSFIMWVLFFFEFMPCLFRITAQNSDYLATVSAKKATKRKDTEHNGRRNQQPQEPTPTQNNTTFSQNGQQTQRSAPAFDYEN